MARSQAEESKINPGTVKTRGKGCLGWGNSCIDLTWVIHNTRLKDRPKWASWNLEILFPQLSKFFIDLLLICCHKVLPSSHLVTLNSEAMGNNWRRLFEPSHKGFRTQNSPVSMLAIRTMSCQVAVSTSSVESCHCYRILVPRPRTGREICLGGNREWRILFVTFFSFFGERQQGKCQEVYTVKW